MNTTKHAGGDPDIAQVAALFADPARARVLMALSDGRALPASVLAGEAGVSPPAASAHLARLREAGMVTVAPSGRYRYYRLVGPEVAAALEALALIAPVIPIRSLRQDTRAHAMRQARTCYDHLAGRLGVAVTTALIDRGALIRFDGHEGTQRRPTDRLSASLPEHPYRLGLDAASILAPLGIDLDGLTAEPSRRPLLRFCVDWTEQHHHLAGRLGAALIHTWLERGWLTRRSQQRAIILTDPGSHALAKHLGLHQAGDAPTTPAVPRTKEEATGRPAAADSTPAHPGPRRSRRSPTPSKTGGISPRVNADQIRASSAFCGSQCAIS